MDRNITLMIQVAEKLREQAQSVEKPEDWGAVEHEMHRRLVDCYEMGQAEMLPIPMLLWCPECGERHVDESDVPPHKTHACQHCGMLWRPALIETTGVRFLPGCKDGE